MGSHERFPKVNDREAAWLAGFIDGEGTICMTSHGTRKGKAPFVGAYNTDMALVQKCLIISGTGRIFTRENNSKSLLKPYKVKPIHKWHATYRQALKVVQAIYPYLVSEKKRKGAREILDHYGVDLAGHTGIQFPEFRIPDFHEVL